MDNAHSHTHTHIPYFLPGSDGSDPLFTAVIIFIVITVLILGVIYFKLHSLPEHLGEKHNSAQLQVISVLTVLALFTHNNIFWVIGLLMAVIKIPDFLTPLESIGKSLAKLANK